MLYTNITQLNVTWRTWWSVHNMHGFYKGKSTQTFWWHFLRQRHSILQEAQLDQPRCTLPVQRAWWRDASRRRAEGRESGCLTAQKNLAQRKEEPPLRSKGGEPLKVAAEIGHWAKDVSNSCRLDEENNNGERGSLVGNGSEVKLHLFLRNTSEWLWYVVDTFAINVFAWW